MENKRIRCSILEYVMKECLVKLSEILPDIFCIYDILNKKNLE